MKSLTVPCPEVAEGDFSGPAPRSICDFSGLTDGLRFAKLLSNLGDTITLYPIPPVFKMTYLSPRYSIVPSRNEIIFKDYHYKCLSSTQNSNPPVISHK